MYCPSCGKNVPDNSKFCLHCGFSITAPESPVDRQVEWEYQDYLLQWGAGDGGRYPLSEGENENTIRLEIWNNQQSWILPQIQELLDNGWQPVTHVGPAAFSFRYHNGGLLGARYIEVNEFRVKMRKPKQSGIDTMGSVNIEPSKYQFRPNYDDAIRELLRRKRKIEAIKLLREQRRIDLKAAKDYVDNIERNM
jgi:hypothetical protein